MDRLNLLADVALHDIVECQGHCIVECDFCKCFENCNHFNDSDSESEECSCECVCVQHFDCRFFCKHSGLCPFVQCDNYGLCGNGIPMYVYRKNNGICSSCMVFIGRIQLLDNMSECSICYEHKKMLQTPCHHEYCYSCYQQWREKHNTCPVCRSEI